MKRSQKWKTRRICPRRDSNSGGSDLWRNALPTTPRSRPWLCDTMKLIYQYLYFSTSLRNFFSAFTKLNSISLAFPVQVFVPRSLYVEIIWGTNIRMFIVAIINHKYVKQLWVRFCWITRKKTLSSYHVLDVPVRCFYGHFCAQRKLNGPRDPQG